MENGEQRMQNRKHIGEYRIENRQWRMKNQEWRMENREKISEYIEWRTESGKHKTDDVELQRMVNGK